MQCSGVVFQQGTCNNSQWSTAVTVTIDVKKCFYV